MINLKDWYKSKSNQNKLFLVAGLLILFVIITTLGFTSNLDCGGDEEGALEYDDAILEVEEGDPASPKLGATLTWSNSIQGCQDQDATSSFDINQLFTKSSTTYTTGKTTKTVEDKCYTYPSGKTYLLEGICKDGKYMWWQKNCSEIDKQLKDGKYECIDGVCANTNEVKQNPVALNNLVIELINYTFPTAPVINWDKVPFKTFTFERKLDGYVYVGITAQLNANDAFWITLDDKNAREFAVLDTQNSETYNIHNQIVETKRYIKAGSHKLKLWTTGKSNAQKIVIRAIPELLLYKAMFHEPSYVFNKNHTWDELKQYGIFDSVNTIIQYPIVNTNEDKNKYKKEAEEWRKKGGRWIAQMKYPTDWNENTTKDDIHNEWDAIINLPHVDGLLFDELGGVVSQKWHQALYAFLQDTTKDKNLVDSDKKFYGLGSCTCDINGDSDGNCDWIIEKIFETGHRVVSECQHVEDIFKKTDTFYYFDAHWKNDISNYYTSACQNQFKNKGFDYVGNSIYSFGSTDYVKYLPLEGHDSRPDVDFYVNNDRTLWHLANDIDDKGNGIFKDMRGVQIYNSVYVNPDTLKWQFKLFRHYFIEGNKEPLSNNPYGTSYLEKPGFEDEEPWFYGDEPLPQGQAWQFTPAETNSIEIKDADKNDKDGKYVPGQYFNNLGFKKHLGMVLPERNKFLWTKRSSQKANIVSQTIKNLVPGNLYTLTLYAANKEDFTSAPWTANNQPSMVSMYVGIGDAAVLVSNKEMVKYAVGDSGNQLTDNQDPPKKLNFAWTINHMVFKPNKPIAQLTLCDWSNPASYSGEKVGQEVIWDFIQIMPYYGDEYK